MRSHALGQGSQRRRRLVVRSLLRWYDRSARDLPWRHTTDPYAIVLSEIMLQQTQVDRVIDKYLLFLSTFPTLDSLAEARRSDVIRAWSGLGYNRRAVRLHELARRVRDDHQGLLPRSITLLEQLPGIGRYTSHAVAAFAYHEPVAVVDTNAERVLSRLFPRERQRMTIWDLAWTVLPRRSSYRWNQGLMDLGAGVCTARTPRCTLCPVVRHCPSAHRVSAAVRVQRREPSRDGLPNRIYRGRIIEALRRAQRPIRLERLGSIIKQPFRSSDLPWLRKLLNGLESDWLIRQSKSRGSISISLPR